MIHKIKSKGAALLVLTLIISVIFSLSLVLAQAEKKAELCHTPPGNPENIYTIAVGETAIQAHFDHGDYVGRCNGEDAGLINLTEAEDQIIPILECVNGTFGSYIAYFGYENKNSVPVLVEVGKKNKLIPAKENSEQPIIFKPGRHKKVFSVQFKYLLSWNLLGRSAIATPFGQSCTTDLENDVANASNLNDSVPVQENPIQILIESGMDKNEVDAAIAYCSAKIK